jgi:hypothetical protein
MQAWNMKTLGSDAVLVRKLRGVTKIGGGTVWEETYFSISKKQAFVAKHGNHRFRQR